jgi:hypothetical protein
MESDPEMNTGGVGGRWYVVEPVAVMANSQINAPPALLLSSMSGTS